MMLRSLSRYWFLLLLFLLAACGNTSSPTPAVFPPVDDRPTPLSSPAAPNDAAYPVDNGDAYPVGGSDTANAAYPAGEPTAEGLLSEPPDPARDFPAPAADSATVGGVLIRDFTNDGGFVPFTPHQFVLASLAYDDDGNPVFISYNDESPRAETLDTGIFIFRDVAPGTYGFIVNLGFTEFPVLTPSGEQLLITVAANEVKDVGQLIVAMP